MLILSNKNTMIIIKLSSKIKHITQNQYEKIIQSLNFNELSCPKCNSKNISVLKGDGFSIVGADYIAIICNDCKKVYGFNDVKYKTNCPKEL